MCEVVPGDGRTGMSDRPAGSYGIDAPRLLVVPGLLIVASVVQADRFFEVEPPLPLHWGDAARDSSRSVHPLHADLGGELLCDVMTARASSSFVRFLERDDVCAREKTAIGKRACRC